MIWIFATRCPLRTWKFNPSVPPTGLIAKEVGRSMMSVLICCLWDICICEARDRGLVSVPDVPYPTSWPALLATGADNILLIAVVLLWSDAHFYWVHRLLHESKWLYQNIHKVHHESFNPDPWSGLSFHPIEAALYFSSLGLVFLIPLPLWLADAMRVGLIIAPIGGHTGFGHKSFPWGFDHYVHHAKFNFNYGSGLFPCNGIWDNLCSTAFAGKLD
mmetsp:Transcript_36725/g.80246  ORF Transcript_36725/g.80246 Transcript_36725/m.80246 type:complete len:217 (+) Transcript_36725:1-651(+)